MRFAIIDTANLFFRAQHVVQGDAFTKAGMALHIVFRSLRRLHRENKIDHMVFCTEGHSWRYGIYPEYKARRKLERLQKTAHEKEDDEVFMSVLTDFIAFISEKTRCTLLHSAGVEGDDFVARWIQLHPEDEHIILSGDTDFFQLLAPNVAIYDGVNERMIRTDSVVNALGEAMEFRIDPSKGKLKIGKTLKDAEKAHIAEQKDKAKSHAAAQKILKEAAAANGESFQPCSYVAEPYAFQVEPNWWRKALFIKIVRGDAGDGIFAAYPGVRYQGSAKKTGIREAWDDHETQGYDYNNFMLQTWDKLIGFDAAGEKLVRQVTVRDQVAFNETLIDLTKQPQEVKDRMDTVIVQAVQKEPVSNVGIEFLRFCAKHQLANLSKEATDHAAYLNAAYAK